MKKIKEFLIGEKGRDILMVLIIILVGTGSFELGRLSKENGSSGIQIEYVGADGRAIGVQPGSVIQGLPYADTATGAGVEDTRNSDKSFFASSRGSKYYSLGCSGGKTIKEENKIYFNTREEAEKAGYALSASCNR